MRIVIVDDHPLFREALAQAVGRHFQDLSMDIVTSINDLEMLIKVDKCIDVILLDLHMPDANGFSGLVHILKQAPDAPILMISAHDEQAVISKVRDLGVKGFVSKSADMQIINKAIEQVLAGQTWFPELSVEGNTSNDATTEALEKVSLLTQKQYQVFIHCSRGLLNKQIAHELSITEATVKAHLTAVMRKLGLNNRTQIALLASKFKNELELSYGE